MASVAEATKGSGMQQRVGPETKGPTGLTLATVPILPDKFEMILSKKPVFISNFNVFILMFVIYFLFYLNSLDLTFIGFTFLLIIFISDQSYKP